MKNKEVFQARGDFTSVLRFEPRRRHFIFQLTDTESRGRSLGPANTAPRCSRRPESVGSYEDSVHHFFFSVENVQSVYDEKRPSPDNKIYFLIGRIVSSHMFEACSSEEVRAYRGSLL